MAQVCLFVYLLLICCLFVFAYFSGSWPMTPIMIVVEFSWIGSYFHPVVHVGVGKIHFRQSERNEKKIRQQLWAYEAACSCSQSKKYISILVVEAK